jgi:hypothetical protein
VSEYLVVPDAVPMATVEAMRAWAATSVHVGASPLKGTFLASRGFAVTFTHDGMPELQRKFPELWPYFDLAVARRPWLPLFGLAERLGMRVSRRAVRAFYFNLLAVPAGVGVGTHIDATLSEVVGEHTTPLIVSVLYLQTPAGGSLRLWRGATKVAEIEPKPGMLICFRGDLGHEVLPVREGTMHERMSLVCEQYALTQMLLTRVAPIKVTAHGMFERVLQRARNET